MTTYKAPLRDMQFVMQDLLNYEKHYQSLPHCDEVNQELIDAILEEASKFSEEVVAPLNAVGDEAGCEMLEDGEVIDRADGTHQATDLTRELALEGGHVSHHRDPRGVVLAAARCGSGCPTD